VSGGGGEGKGNTTIRRDLGTFETQAPSYMTSFALNPTRGSDDERPARWTGTNTISRVIFINEAP